MFSWTLLVVCLIGAWSFLRILGSERERRMRVLEVRREQDRRERERRDAAAAAVVQASRPPAPKPTRRAA